MYDYLAKVILLGPSGAGKFVSSISPENGCADHPRTRSCLLHRFVKDECTLRFLCSNSCSIILSGSRMIG